MGSGMSQLDIDVANNSATAVCASQTVTAPASALINGTLASGGVFSIYPSYSDGVGGVKLRFVSVGVINTVVFTIVGKDADGNSITETVTGVTTTPVFTTKFYSAVTSITPNITTTSAFSVGTIGTAGGEIVSRSVAINRLSADGAAVAVSGLIGTCNYTFQQTFSDIAAGTTSALWFDLGTAQTTQTANAVAKGATATRVKINTYTDGAEFQFHVNYNAYR